MSSKNKKAKNLHLSEDCIKYFSHLAIEEGTVFKLYVEKLLEGMAKKKKV